MANHASAKKEIRKTIKRTIFNKNKKSRMKTFYNKVIIAINKGLLNEAKKLLPKAQSEIMKSAAMNLIHRNIAIRKTQRLFKKIKNLPL